MVEPCAACNAPWSFVRVARPLTPLVRARAPFPAPCLAPRALPCTLRLALHSAPCFAPCPAPCSASCPALRLCTAPVP